MMLIFCLLMMVLGLPREANGGSLPSICSASSAQFYPDPSDCGKFYHCSSGHAPSHKSCAAGTKWSVQLGNCDHEANVVCPNPGHQLMEKDRLDDDTAEGCGDCACKKNFLKKDTTSHNNCVPPAKPIHGGYFSCSCSCDLEKYMGSCIWGFSCGCDCDSSSATCRRDLMPISNWQNKLEADKKVRDVILPGTHHSGLISGQTEYSHWYVMDWAVTQDLSIRNQLDHGVRFFDMSLYDVDGLVHLAHRNLQSKALATGVPFLSVVIHTLSFLFQNPSEFIVWRLQWVIPGKGEDKRTSWDKVEDILNGPGDQYFYRNVNNPLDMTVSDVRKHIIVCAEGGALPSFRSSMECQGSGSKTASDEGKQLVTKLNDYISGDLNLYSNKFNFLEAYCTPNFGDKFYAAYNILTSFGLFGRKQIKELKEHCNTWIMENLITELNRKRGMEEKNKMNAIMVDLINPTISTAIISLNHEKLGNLGLTDVHDG